MSGQSLKTREGRATARNGAKANRTSTTANPPAVAHSGKEIGKNARPMKTSSVQKYPPDDRGSGRGGDVSSGGALTYASRLVPTSKRIRKKCWCVQPF
jgi:hypothetical protein